ncbi:MAG: AAA family ATPase [Bacteroidota bacterium]
MVKRILEKRLKGLTKHFPATVILGPRQVGKTTLVREVSPSLHREVLYLDLENPDDLRVLQNNPKVYFGENKEKCVIIDEVQRLPSLFPRLRPVIDSYRKAGRFILLGSANPTILKESSDH